MAVRVAACPAPASSASLSREPRTAVCPPPSADPPAAGLRLAKTGRRRVWPLGAATIALSATVSLLACGARTPIPQGENAGASGAAGGDAGSAGGVEEVTCVVTDDCEGAGDRCRPVSCRDGVCVAGIEKRCDDGDPCTTDSCNGDTGACEATPATLDLDGDGHRGPLPGHLAGDAGSCGDDCDDTSAKAHPGGEELCDGVDNDCNGVIDDAASFIPLAGAVAISDPSSTQASSGDLASTSLGFLATVNAATAQDAQIFARPLGASGTPTAPLALINATTGDASDAVLVYTGDRFGLAWEDRRSGDYEIYFTTLGPDGKKVREDLRLTNAPDFSVNAAIGWNGTTFTVVWQDRRSGDFRLRGQRLSLDGDKIGDDTEVFGVSGEDTESPALAVSTAATAVAYRVGNESTANIELAILGDDLRPLAGKPPTVLATGGNFEAPAVVPNGDSFFVTWGDRDPFRLFGAVVDKAGQVVVSPRQISPAGGQSRSAVPIALGDRFVVVYGRTASSGYDVFSLTLDEKLAPTGPAAVVSAGLGDELPRAAALGGTGSIGVLFNGKIDNQKGGVKGAAFFTRLECRGGLMPAP
jgi:hypothetical protein